MKKTFIASVLVATPMLLSAQSAFDAYSLSQTELRGTARFMSMGGAFTALGGDLSTLTQNPAGIGVYRRSEIGVTLDISPRSLSAATSTDIMKSSSTPVSCNNFGYVGSVNLSGLMNTFSWGATYNRVASFNRRFGAFNGAIPTSLSNYVAYYTPSSVDPGYMDFVGAYNPYLDSNIDWMSIMGYNAGMISYSDKNDGGGYSGIWQPGSVGESYVDVYERGYVDEYSIDFGGNIANTVMWGIGFGITDLQYSRSYFYEEYADKARVPKADSKGNLTNETAPGEGYFNIDNYRAVNGNGFNLKVGLIFKPINEIRIGVAFHTPTWYTFRNSNNAYYEYEYEYQDATSPLSDYNPVDGYGNTAESYYNFRVNSPWKFMVGAAAVLGSSAIISADYELQSFNSMSVSNQYGYAGYVADNIVNDDINRYFKAANIFRIGAEYRVTPSFSVRAGYNYSSTACKEEVLNGAEVANDARILESTDPSYTMNRGTNAFSLGLGYRYKIFYIDAAYVHGNRKSTFKPYSNFGNTVAPEVALTENTNSVVFSLGFKF